MRQISLALLHAHQKGILHRDLKPQNIFLRRPASWPCQDPATATQANAPTLPTGTPQPAEVHALLLDFGLAKLADRDFQANADSSQGRRSMQSLTRSGEIFGTPAYMPPEQTRGAKDVDARADIYSLGAALYHALAGAPPFDAASLAELLIKVQMEDPAPPSQGNADVDADLDTMTLKCLQKDPKDRYQNAGDLAEDLKRWLAGEPVAARPIGPVGRLWRRARRNKAVAIPVALLVLAVVGVVLWITADAGSRAWRLALLESEFQAAMKDRHFDDAATAADKARDLAPNDLRWREKKDTALYEKAATSGHAELVRWRAHRDAAAAARQATAPEGPGAIGQETAGSPADRDKRREERWKAERSLRTEDEQREDAWSRASVAFTEALTHRVTKEAEDALTELYWDRYVRAEKERDSSAMNTYESYVVEFGKEPYARELRGRRDVRVRFWLPTAWSGKEVTAYLSEYRPCANPPVRVPAPYDVAHARPGEDEVERLTADDANWKPGPLSAAALGGAPATAVALCRAGDLFEPRVQEASRVPLVAAREGTRPYVEFSAQLLRGSYLLYVPPGQGLLATRYPFEVAREYAWNEAAELPAEEDVPPLPPGATVDASDIRRPYWVYAPAGPYTASGDPQAPQKLSRDAAVIRLPEERPLADLGASRSLQGYYVARFEVTCAMYGAYLNDRAWHTSTKAYERVPRRDPMATVGRVYLKPDPNGLLSINLDEDVPVFAVSALDADDYCAWLTKQAGGGRWKFGLPTEDEWEKAARGPDGRCFPWGDSFDETLCAMIDSRTGESKLRQPEPFGLFPVDESPYGVRDMAGDICEWTRSKSRGRGWRIYKGGAWGTGASNCRAAARSDGSPEELSEQIGFRVFAHRTP